MPGKKKNIIIFTGYIIGFFLVTILTLGGSWIPVAAQESAGESNYRIYMPLQVSPLTTTTERRAPEWLERLNYYRAMAALPEVAANSLWQTGLKNHAQYMVKTDTIAHDEDPASPWYTAEGQEAARKSNLMACSSTSTTDSQAVDSWIQAPFHALGLLNPGLLQSEFGSYRETDGNLQMAAAIDVLRGTGEVPESVSYPILFPGNDAVVPLTSYSAEYPDPLSACPGYTSPAGLPVLIQMGSGNNPAKVNDYHFSENGNAVESCVFTAETYKNPDPNAQELGRSILSRYNAVVLIPRKPLLTGSHYSVAITINNTAYSWSFQVSQP